MAAESDVVRISYREIEEIARLTEETEKEEALLREKQEAKKKNDEERKKKQDEDRKKKRPTAGIYKPPSILKHKQEVLEKEQESNERPQDEAPMAHTDGSTVPVSGENWEEDLISSEQSSKENSVEKEIASINAGLDNLNVKSDRKGKSRRNDDLRRKKRPEIQRYVPKGRMLEKHEPETSGDGSEDLVDELSSPSPLTTHSPSPGPVTPSPRKIDLKNMQVTVVYDKAARTDESPGRSAGSKQQSSSGRGVNKSNMQGQTYSRGRGQRFNQRSNQRGQFGGEKSREKQTVEKTDDGGEVNFKDESDSAKVVRASQDDYLVPSRPHTIGQEADRTDTIGSDETSNEFSEIKPGIDRQALMMKLNKFHKNKKSRSYDKLDKQESWEEEGYYPDPKNLGTMVFERSRSSEQLNLSARNAAKPPMPRSSSGGIKNPSKKFSLGGMRKRTDSLSSDLSTGTGSDWSTEDLDWDKEVDPSSRLDWTEEVDRELALQVQDETQKMNAWFEKQEMGLSQEPWLSQDDLLSNRSNNARGDPMTSSSQGFYRDPPASRLDGLTSEKSNTLPFAHRRRNREEPRGRPDIRRGSLGLRSRDSSVSSAHSVQSVQSAYSSEGRRRRRRRRKSSTSSQTMRGGSAERKNMSIQVTCGGGREVKVGGQGGRSFSRQNSSEGYYNDTHRGKGENFTGRNDKNKDDNWKESKGFENKGHYRGDRGKEFGNRERASSETHQYDTRDRWPRDDRGGGHSRQGKGRTRRESGGKAGGYQGHETARNPREDSRHSSNRPDYDQGDRHSSNRPDYDHSERHRSDTADRRHQETAQRGRGNRDPNRWDERGDKFSRNKNLRVNESRPGMKLEKAASSEVHPGGILHLPQQSRSPDPGGQAGGQRDGHWNRGPKGRGRERTRSGSQQKTLFDPDNPSKPIVIEDARPKLDFKETGSHPSSPHSPQYTGPPPPPPPQPEAAGYGRGYPGFYPPQGYGYGYNMPVPHPMMGGPVGMFYGYPPQFREGQPMFPGDSFARDPYYQGESEPEPGLSGNSAAHNKLMAERLLQEAAPMDKQLNNLIARRVGGEDTVQLINQLRRELLVRYENMLLLDPELSNRHNVEQALWKSVFYQMVEVTRRQLADDHADDTKLHLNKILTEGTSFYENLLEKLQSTFNFKLSSFLDPNFLAPENLGRTVKLALLSVQRSMICLGDIARYKEQHNSSGKVNYAKARSWYTKAQQIAPKNGRPYNQLAILALYTKRKLDAVYFYMRSLAASNPFLTARESLMSLFDEARKKAEAAEKKRMEERSKQQALRQHHGGGQHRLEIWVRHDGTSSQARVSDGYDEDLSKLETVELNKRFILSFLNVHGKLFTKIGMEMFPDSCGQMLQEFQVLLKDNAIGPTRLLQLMAINMFAVENTALKDESLECSYKSLLQQHSVQMGLDMFGILVARCARLLREHVASTDYPGRTFSRELEELVPGVKVWTDWMICHNDLWNPPPAIRDPSIGPQIDVWSETATLCNILKEIDTSHVEFYTDRKEGLESVILSEDTMMSGFVPLLSTPLNNTFVDTSVDKEMARDCLRVEKLRVFGEYLCGIDTPMLAYSGETRKYYSVAPPEGYEADDKTALSHQLSEDEDVVVEGEEEVVQEDEGAGLHDEHVQQLRAKKTELQAKMHEKTRIQEKRKNMLEKNRHRSIEIEIRPIFLIPDTNCFIDHLPSLQKLITEKQFTIVIPLVVINELDGLAQGKRLQHCDTADHVEKVRSRARSTIDYLEQEFEKKHTHLKALTSKGTTMETISFRSEETDLTGNNDDLILSCCTYYCKDKARDYMPKDKDTPVHLYREVVLLTDDRNLRLKAHTHNVPVKEVPAFMKWSSAS